jgi:hypothetical protein
MVTEDVVLMAAQRVRDEENNKRVAFFAVGVLDACSIISNFPTNED